MKPFTILLCLLMISCVQDDDFTTAPQPIDMPTLGDQPPLSIHTVYTLWQQRFLKALNEAGLDTNNPLDAAAIAVLQSQTQLTFQTATTGSTNYMEGYVISSDQAGNFFEELIIQDTPQNPTTGIRLLIDTHPLYTTYEFGRKIAITLDGLTVGIQNGVFTIGIQSGVTINKIPAFMQHDILQRFPEVATITPLPMTIEAFTTAHTNLYIQLTDIQFHRKEVLGDRVLSFAAAPHDIFTGQRIIEHCSTGAQTLLSTSTFADFRGLLLPSRRGTFQGILTKNFFGDRFTVVLNTPTELALNQKERCDPLEIACGLATTTGATTLFADNFENQTPNTPISGNGWTNYIESGTQSWETFQSDGTNASLGISARISAHGSDDSSTIAWLITPEISLAQQNGVTIRFQTSTSFADTSQLDVLFSKDWDGTPATINTATWGVLSAATIAQNDDFFGDWIPSGIIDLSCEEGTIHIAFRYQGHDQGSGDANGTYELDEVQIEAK